MNKLTCKILAPINRVYSYFHRRRITILMVHGVMHNHDASIWTPLRNHISPLILDRVLRCISKNYNIVSINDAVCMINGEIPTIPYSMVLSFDDGYRNHLTHVLPILNRYNARAIFYIASGYPEKNEPFWFDRLDYAIQQISSPCLSIKIGTTTILIDNTSSDNLKASFTRLRNAAKDLHHDDLEMLSEINNLTFHLEKLSGKSLLDISSNDDWSTHMNWQEINKAIDSGLITIGSHTVDHIRLSLVDNEMAKDQISRSKKTIEEKTGESCHHFCFPNGAWSPAVAKIVQECGFKSATTTEKGTNKIGADPFSLRRISIPIVSNDDEILAKVSGLWDSVVNFRNIFRL